MARRVKLLKKLRLPVLYVPDYPNYMVDKDATKPPEKATGPAAAEGPSGQKEADKPETKAAKNSLGFLKRVFKAKTPAVTKPTSGEKVRVPWMFILEKKWAYISGSFVEISSGLWSRDATVRRMSLFFLFSLTGIIVISVFTWSKFQDYRRSRVSLSDGAVGVEHLGEFLNKQAEEAKRRHSTLNLGEFLIELKRDSGDKKVPGVVGMAQVEIVIECDNKETCSYIGGHHVQARNQLTNVFTAIDREELLSHEGKKRIKKTIVEKLNVWLQTGKIVNIYFANVMVD